MAPAREAWRRHSVSGSPPRYAARKPAKKASPAPLVSATSPAGVAGTRMIRPSESQAIAPRAPSVQTASRLPAATRSRRKASGSARRSPLRNR